VTYRDPRHDEEVYTIKQVTELTGVSANTIRSWERRHGFPHPGRTGSNYRSYTFDDVRRIRDVRDARDRGRTVDQAIRDLALERGNQTTTNAGQSQSPAHTPNPSALKLIGAANHLDRLGDALASLDLGAAGSVLTETTWTSSIARICFELLLPVDRDLERQIAIGALAHPSGALARAWVNRKLLHAFDISNPDEGRELALVIPLLDGQERSLAICHAINVSLAGYRVALLYEALRATEARDLVVELQPAIVVFTGRGALAEAAILAFLAGVAAPADAAWKGIVAVTDGLTIPENGAIVLASDAATAITAIEVALREDRSLHLVRTP
jgi:DNA-binding transcriptional MerR regulator